MGKAWGWIGSLLTATATTVAASPPGTPSPYWPANNAAAVRPALPVSRAALAIPAAAHAPAAQLAPRTPSTAALAPEAARLVEINIQLAWLADSVTFLDQLTARVNGAAVEISGDAPNNVVRDWALRVAKQHTTLPVTNAIKTSQRKETRSVEESPQAITSAALATLNQAYRSPSVRFKVNASSSSLGQVDLFGEVPSHEDKLACSQRLRSVRGCTSVQNFMTVAPHVRDGKAFAYVSVDGRLRVPAVMPVDALATRTASRSMLIAATTPEALPSFRKTLPSTTPSLSAVQLTSATHETPSSSLTEMKNPPVVVKKPIASTSSTPAITQSAAPKPATIVTALPAPAAPQTGLKARLFSRSAETPRLIKAAKPRTPTRVSAVPAVTLPAPIQLTPVIETADVPKPALQLPASEPVTHALAVVQAAPAPPVTPTVPVATVAPVAPVAQVAQVAQVNNAKLPELKQKIAHICAGSTRDLSVLAGGEHSLWISFKAPNVSVGNMLGRAIMNMPELVPYKVALEVQLEP